MPDNEFDIASIIPEKGDPRRPPAWLSRAILYVCIGIILLAFCWNLWPKISWIATDLAICLFIALAMEPIIAKLVNHGLKRTIASMITWGCVLAIAAALIYLFGAMFIDQMTGLFKSVPGTYESMRSWLNSSFNTHIPDLKSLGLEIANNAKTDWLTDIAGKTFGLVGGIGSILISLMIVLIVTYYIAAYAAGIRKGICRLIRPSAQKRFLKAWEIVQNQVSSFLYSRIILAFVNAVCMSIFMIILDIPYWLPLSLFCGIVSQFIPTIGTYIGGALPILSALGSNGIKYAVFVLIYIIIYQQIENLLLSPMISQKTMDLNPAVALLAVFVFGAMFGALGAFLALPIAASIKTVVDLYATRHDVVESELIDKTEEIPAVDENDKHYIIESDGNNGFIAHMEGNDDSFTADTPGEALTGLMNKLKANDDGQ